MIRNTFILAGLAAAAVTGAAVAQVALPPSAPPVGTITAEDGAAFRDLLEGAVPPRYTAGLIRWYNAIAQRQQAAAPPPAAPTEPAPKN